MLLSNGPLSPEHIYQEIVGYGKTRNRGKILFCSCQKRRGKHFLAFRIL